MEHIKSILDKVLSREKISRGLATHEFFSNWKELVGESLASQTRPIRITGGVLWVYVNSTALRHHLMYLTPKMLENIRKKSPGTEIYSIKFTLYAES